MLKENIILDTDISNEVDDQFALTYLMKSIDKFNLEAITIAPFCSNGYVKIKDVAEGTDISYNTACKILDMIGEEKYKDIIYKGATKYFYESKEMNVGAQKIIDISRKNEHTTIIAIGAITNVALAMYHAPDIINKIDIIWLGGNSFLSSKNDEYNFRQDVEGVRYVFESKAELVVIPCKNVASDLSTSIYELEHYLKDKGEIGNYLCEIFSKIKKNYTVTPTDEIGQTKTLWDLSAIAYLINKDWFIVSEVSCPHIDEDLSYKFTSDKHTIKFVNNLRRNKIYQDFFIKMGCNNETY